MKELYALVELLCTNDLCEYKLIKRYFDYKASEYICLSYKERLRLVYAAHRISIMQKINKSEALKIVNYEK